MREYRTIREVNGMRRDYGILLATLMCIGCSHKVVTTARQVPTVEIPEEQREQLMVMESYQAYTPIIKRPDLTHGEALGLPNPGGDVTYYVNLQHRHLRKSSYTVSPARSLGTSLQERVAAWVRRLLNGSIEYKVPSTMYWKEASTVTVVILGQKASVTSGINEPTGGGPLKISDRMKVLVSCPDNPDEFTIVQEGGAGDTQFVPEDSGTTWNWSVTPKFTGKSQKLQVTAWVLYPGQDDKILQQLPVYTAIVNVHVPGFGECLKRLVEGDPDYWLKYGLPGGAGFIFLAGGVASVRKWIASRKKPGAVAAPAGG